MFLSKLSQKEKIGLFASAILVSLVILDRLILTPINDRIQQINREIKIGEKQLVMGLRNLNQKEFVSSEYKKYESYLKNSGSDEEKTTAILSEIEILAKKSSVSLIDIKPQQNQNIDSYKEYAIEVETESSMDALLRFLHELNASSQLLRAEKIRLNLKDKDSSVVKSLIQITKISNSI